MVVSAFAWGLPYDRVEFVCTKVDILWWARSCPLSRSDGMSICRQPRATNGTRLASGDRVPQCVFCNEQEKQIKITGSDGGSNICVWFLYQWSTLWVVRIWGNLELGPDGSPTGWHAYNYNTKAPKKGGEVCKYGRMEEKTSLNNK